MNTITYEIKDDALIIMPSGRIDSSNASDFEAAANEALAKCDSQNTVVDAENLEYISSAGLRVLLKIRKSRPGMKMVNVSGDVYDILDMTGFTEMIKVEKAYRVMSIEGCEVIGQGANGLVYRIDADTIIKVYRNPDCLPDIQRERELARRAFVLGIPTAIPYDVVRVGQSYGSVFELLNSKSFAKLMSAEPENIDKYTDMSVELLRKIHSTEVKPEDMPDMKKVVVGWVDFLRDYLEPEKWEKLSSLVAAVPERHTMMHGDYHIKNVMLQNGESLLIDMDTLSQGDPVFEFASIYNAYIGFSAIDRSQALSFLGLPYEVCQRIWKRTVMSYFGTDDEAKIQEIEDKAALIGFVRLLRRFIRRNDISIEENRRTAEYYKSRIEEYLSRVDTLSL